jgi:hypothetical protein
MWGLLPRKTQILIIAGLAILLAWAIEGATGLLTGNPPSEWKLISLVVMVISTGMVTIASALWRWVWKRFPIVARKFFPDLTGTWAGELVSTWTSPATGEGIAPIPVTIWIRQGLFSTSIKLRSGEMLWGGRRGWQFRRLHQSMECRDAPTERFEQVPRRPGPR